MAGISYCLRAPPVKSYSLRLSLQPKMITLTDNAGFGPRLKRPNSRLKNKKKYKSVLVSGNVKVGISQNFSHFEKQVENGEETVGTGRLCGTQASLSETCVLI